MMEEKVTIYKAARTLKDIKFHSNTSAITNNNNNNYTYNILQHLINLLQDHLV